MEDLQAWRTEVAVRETCKDCGAAFEITNGEKEFFEQKNFTLPKRCKTCRIKMRAQREAEKRANN